MKSIIAAVFGLLAVAAAVPLGPLKPAHSLDSSEEITARGEDIYSSVERLRSQDTITQRMKPIALSTRPRSSTSLPKSRRRRSIDTLTHTKRDTHLPAPKQYITTHNAQTGKAIFSSAVPTDVQPDRESAGDSIMQNTQLYVTDSFPVDFAHDADLAANARYRQQPPGLVNARGSVLRYVDFAPASPGVMHRTVSLDYAVVLEGEIDLVLDSGERRPMKRGDIAIQRGTMHAWKNNSPDQWSRVLFVLQPSVPIEMNGQKYEEAVGGIAS